MNDLFAPFPRNSPEQRSMPTIWQLRADEFAVGQQFNEKRFDFFKISRAAEVHEEERDSIHDKRMVKYHPFF
jgi:hypothetical protein